MRFFKKCFYVFIRGLTHIGYAAIWRLKVEGKENIPKEGRVIIAANHRSFGDPPLVGVSVPREVHFLAKQELFAFKPFGWTISALNAHPLNRSGDVAAFKMAKRLLEQGYAMIVFPEGRRSKTDELAAAKPGVGMLAFMTQSPVVPTYLHNTGYLKELRPVKVKFGPLLRPENFATYQEMSDEVMRNIARLRDEVLKGR